MPAKEKILFQPFGRQEEFIKLVMCGQYSFIFFGGAVRGGKTFVILGLFIMLCWYFPESKYVVVRRDIEILKATTLKSFYEIVPESITAQMPKAHNGWEWICTNGSVIKFFSENISRDPDLMRFRGLEYDSIAFDEMDVVEDTFRKAFERAGTWKMKERAADIAAGIAIPPRCVIGTSNPQDGWVKTEIYDLYAEDQLPGDWAYLQSRVYDNTFIDAGWIEQLRSTMLPEDFLKFVEGDWNVDKNRKKFFEQYDDKIHYAKNDLFPFDPNAETWLSFDFNYNPTTCTVYQVHRDVIIGMRNYGIEGGTLKLCKLIMEDEELLSVNRLLWNVTGDTSGSSHTATGGDQTDYNIIQETIELNDSQLINVHSRNKAIVYSRRLCDHFLWKVPFVMDSRMTRLRNDMLIAKPTENGSGLYKDRKKGYGMDFLDTFRYFVDAYFPGGIDDINRYADLAKLY